MRADECGARLWAWRTPRRPDRAVVTGIRFVLKCDIARKWLPREPGRGSGTTRWRRRRDNAAAPVVNAGSLDH